MKVVFQYSHAPEHIIALVAGIADGLRLQGTRNPDLLLEMVKPLFPDADIYHGHTHYRLRLHGTANGDSVYIERFP
jgi:hypothetical protein